LRRETWERGFESFWEHITYRLDPEGAERRAGFRLPPDAPPTLRRGAGWGLLFALTVLSISRYGRGEKLKRRFQEEPELAAAPCRLCGEPTHDYGALIHHRAARAWAAGVIVAVAALVLGLTLGPIDHGGRAPLMWALAIVIGAMMGAARWSLWTREVHLCHRRPSIKLLGFAFCAVLVVGLLSSVTLYTMRSLDWPRRTHHIALVRMPRLERGGRRLRQQGPAASEAPARRAVPRMETGAPARRAMRQGEPSREEQRGGRLRSPRSGGRRGTRGGRAGRR
jgi:hypothetical protein